MNAFTSIFRTHEGLNPQKNAQVYNNIESATHFAYYAKIYKALHFYRRQLFQEAAESGIPVNRAMYLEFPYDTNTLKISYEQFMLGSEFIVAPILDKNVQTKNVYLPAGIWKELWSGMDYNSTGQWVTFSDRTDKPVVLYRPESSTAKIFKDNLQELGIIVP
jgi:alpha-glucosidase (family GH31 glycosyl hydrolase)